MHHKYKVAKVAIKYKENQRWWKTLIWFGNQLVQKSLPYLEPFSQSVTHSLCSPRCWCTEQSLSHPHNQFVTRDKKYVNNKFWSRIKVWINYFLLQNWGQGGGCKWAVEIKSFGKYAQGLTSLIGCLFYICLNQIYQDQVYCIYIDIYIEIYWQIYWDQKPRV